MYLQSLTKGSLLYNLTYKWQDRVYFNGFNDETNSQGEYGLLNASLSYMSQDEKWQTQFYGENLTDEEYSNAGHDFSPTGVNLIINPPLTYGVKLIYHFD